LLTTALAHPAGECFKNCYLLKTSRGFAWKHKAGIARISICLALFLGISSRISAEITVGAFGVASQSASRKGMEALCPLPSSMDEKGAKRDGMREKTIIGEWVWKW